MSWLIYKHTNKVNGKVYIGQTKKSKPEYRWNEGKGYTFRNPNAHFPKAIQKYGWGAFVSEVIERDIQTQEEANQRETFWIRYYDSVENGYNANYGGDAKGEVSNSTRQKLSANIKGRIRITNGKEEKNIRPSELESYLSKGWKKQRLNDLSGSIFVNKNGKNKMVFPHELDSYLQKGWKKGFYIVLTEEMRKAKGLSGEANPFYGKKHSESTKKKLSEIRQGKARSFDSVEKQKKTIIDDGKKWVNNGEEEKWVSSNEIEEFLLSGYVLGRLPGAKRIKAQKKVIRIDDGKVFNSATEAALSFCNRKCAVSIAILKKQRAGGFMWCYEADKEKIPEIIAYFKNKANKRN